jgi:hypothetical protein
MTSLQIGRTSSTRPPFPMETVIFFFSNTNFYHCSSFTNSATPSLPNHRELLSSKHSSQSSPVDHIDPTISSPPQREMPTTTPLDLPPHPSDTSGLTSHQPSGWNMNHPYNTRFKRRIEAPLATLAFTPFFTESALSAYLATDDAFPSSTSTPLSTIQHFAYSATPKDTLHFGELQSDPDKHHFDQDMIREVTDLLASSTLEVIPRHTIPSDNPPLQPIWSFRRKRPPDWSILKYKARCPNGGKQIEGINFWETYAPVVSWRTVHLTLILSLLSGLKSRQVDYVSAYTQAPLEL